MKTKIVLIFLLFYCSLKTDAQPNLVACYPLDNTPNDFSGNNFNGSAYNLIPDSDRFGNPNHAYYFSGNNSGILISDSSFHLNSFTYSLWCKLSSLPSPGWYFSLISIGGDIADQSILIGNNPGIGHLGFGFGSWDTIPTPHHRYQGFLPVVNQWYHIVVTRDNDSLKMYINNNLICIQTTGFNAGYLGPVQTFSIGARIDTLTQNFIGDIDEVKIFDRVLTAPEVSYLNSSCKYYTSIPNLYSDENSISVFPNPFNNYVVLNGTIANVELILYDALGKEIKRQITNTTETRIHTENLIKGIYYLRCLKENKCMIIKLIKM